MKNFIGYIFLCIDILQMIYKKRYVQRSEAANPFFSKYRLLISLITH